MQHSHAFKSPFRKAASLLLTKISLSVEEFYGAAYACGVYPQCAAMGCLGVAISSTCFNDKL